MGQNTCSEVLKLPCSYMYVSVHVTEDDKLDISCISRISFSDLRDLVGW